MVHYAPLALACLLGSAAAGVAPSDGNLDRRETQSSTDGTLHCGIFASGAKSTISNLQNDLQTGKLKDKYWTVGPGECNRVHCYDTSGIYVCNDGTGDVRLNGPQIAKGVSCVHEHCCRKDVDPGVSHKGTSGQKFFRSMGMNFNIATGYANCNDPPNIRPSNAGGWDVNPVCMGGVQVPDAVDCGI